jgi:TonB-linked SusC/RagA family outer membrane protein
MFVKLRLFNLLLFLGLFFSISAQEMKVKGVVKDSETGETIIGANILISNLKIGTISDINGNFSINIKSKTASLIVSYVGYKTQTIEINGESNVIVLLKQNSQSMDEVVVVGYGVQKKESVIGAISAISNKTLISVPVSNLSQNLAGKISGVQIVQPSGEVGRDEAQIFVRGMGTYGDASPLIVIDGVMRSSFSQIDPNEVESINVLKDASATSVYGIKGANGVIVVTTRRGSEGKSKITASAQFAVTQPTRIPYRLGSYETAVLKNQHYIARMLQPENTALDIATYRTGASPYTHPDVDWMDEVVKDFSSLQQYNVNISGGTKKLKYFVSGGFMNQGSNYNNDPYTNFNRFNFRTNLDINVSKNLNISLNIGSRIENRTNDGNAWQTSS